MATFARHTGGAPTQRSITVPARPSGVIPTFRGTVSLPPPAAKPPPPATHPRSRAEQPRAATTTRRSTRSDAPAQARHAKPPTAAAHGATHGGLAQRRIARATPSEDRAWEEARARSMAKEERLRAQARETASDDHAWKEALQRASARAAAEEEQAWQEAVARAQVACAAAEEREWAARIAQVRAKSAARDATGTTRAHLAPARRGALVLWP
jgi:hypothetical protein